MTNAAAKGPKRRAAKPRKPRRTLVPCIEVLSLCWKNGGVGSVGMRSIIWGLFEDREKRAKRGGYWPISIFFFFFCFV
jgi:hypothetical protein